MDGVLGWLDKFFQSAADTAVKTYLEVVHWAVRGITSLVFGVFGNAAKAWTVLYSDSKWFLAQIENLARAAHLAHAYTLLVRIPQVLKWAAGLFARLWRDLKAAAAALVRAVAELRARITSTARALTAWTLQHVYAPLAAYARQVRADLLKWGWTAWWWVTHPDKLAAALLLHLVAAIEANAWQLGGMLGKFAMSLVLRNVAKLALLAESVVTAVV